MISTLTAPARNAPMPAAPMKYAEDGRVEWDAMWDSFCELAQTGGPPHRGHLLRAPFAEDPRSAEYSAVVAELTRGILLVSGLRATPGEPGWLNIACDSPIHARWLAHAIAAENVEARYDGTRLSVPCGANFTVTGEIKNVITAIAKTTHYWHAHLQRELKAALWAEHVLARVKQRLVKRMSAQ
jgi:sirohydrochlorin cobaltochelatase